VTEGRPDPPLDAAVRAEATAHGGTLMALGTHAAIHISGIITPVWAMYADGLEVQRRCVTRHEGEAHG